MLDTVALLTPLIVLIIALLFGFAGCSYRPGTVGDELWVDVRVPTELELTVIRIQFEWTDPSNVTATFFEENPVPTRTLDGKEDVFRRLLYASAGSGGWTVRCHLMVRDITGAEEQSGAECMVMVGGEIREPMANFEASGTPSAVNFAVTCRGVTSHSTSTGE
jgi:hypothetical protein